MTWLIAAAAAVVIAPVLFLLPRMRLQCRYKPGLLQVSFNWLWAGLRYDSLTRESRARLLCFPVKLKPETSEQTTLQTESAPEPHPLPPPHRPSKPAQPADQPPPKRPSPKGNNGVKPARAKDSPTALRDLWRERALFIRLARWAIGLTVRAVRTAKVELLRLQGSIATPDVALTGVLYGLLQPAASLLPRPTEIRLTADFESDYPQLEFAGAMALRPLTLVSVVSVQLLRLPWWELWRFYRRKRRRVGTTTPKKSGA